MTGENDRAAPVELAHASDFLLGGLAVAPSTREVRRGDLREQLEPRVMQVLVALHDSQGHVVSRDDLIARCWEGRVVGDDAINRAIGRLRRLSEADGGASFQIETIPRVGYRLMLTRQGGVAATIPPASPSPRSAVFENRRWLIGGAATILAGAAAGYAFLHLSPTTPPVPDAAVAEIAHGRQLLRQASMASITEAVGVFDSLTKKYPATADAWGGLAFAYALLAHNQRNLTASLRLRSTAAADRALALDPHNALALEARGWALPRRGHWLAAERYFREGLKYHPEHDGLLLDTAFKLADVGRNREAADYIRRATDNTVGLDSALAWNSIQIFWSANRLSEADEAAERAHQMLPRNVGSWFWRAYLLMFTGRTDAALALLRDTDNRPSGIPEDNFEIEIAVAQALQSKQPQDMTRRKSW